MAYFGVFDGHGGNKACDYLMHNLHVNLFNQKDHFRFAFCLRLASWGLAIMLLMVCLRAGRFDQAFKEAFKLSDEQLITELTKRGLASGSSACCALLVNNLLTVAWAGPSFTVFSFHLCFPF